MKKVTIYIVCNSQLALQLKKIEGFRLDLGTSLTDSNNRVNPQDLTIQYHHMHHQEIVQRLGWLGSLAIYSLPSCKIDTVYACFDMHKIEYKLDSTLSLYQNLNNAIDPVIKLSGIGVKTEVENSKPEQKTITKSLNKMSEAERLAWARGLK